MRLLAVLLGAVAALGGSLLAFNVMRSVGPEDRTGEFGFGAAAKAAPGGGTLLESRNFPLVVRALRRELGAGGAIEALDVQPQSATAIARAGGVRKLIQIDASGRSQVQDGGAAPPAALLPIARLDPAAIDKLVAGAREQAGGAPVQHLALSGGPREWTVVMNGGTPSTLVANLDGGGLRLPGEPNPEPVGASPDSLLRAANLERVLTAAAKEGSRVLAMDVRPDRASLTLDAGGRDLALEYGYGAQLTSRELRARTGDAKPVPLSALDPAAIERLARTARRAVRSRGLADVQYVLLDPVGSLTGSPELHMYLAPGARQAYVAADLHGRGLTWPGRS